MLAAVAAAASATATPIATALDVAIVGGGPCGLATALALSKAPCLQGARVAVFEADEFSPKGASIQISRPGWAALESLDAEAASRIRETGAPVTSVSIRSFDGKSATPLLLTLMPCVCNMFLVGFQHCCGFWGSNGAGSLTFEHL